MTSVWKRLQRVGKKASKFQFTAFYQSLSVECVRGGRWLPNKLVVVWMRRKRRKAIKAMSWQPNISNPFRGIIVWPEPEPVDITVTLYKDSKPDSEFEDKEWTFVIEDESQTGRRKPIATGVINMADYVSTESRTFDITLTLKVASKKLVSASLDLNLSCVLIKEGMATDDDMISIGSMMSLNDTADFNLDDDDDMEVAPSPRLRHKRNLSSGNVKFSPAAKLKDQTDSKVSSSLSASPLGGKDKKTDRIRSKSALGENVKAIVSEAQRKQDALKRLSTGSDISSEISDNGQDVSNDKNKMEAELIKWTRSRTKGYRGVKVKNMTTSWRDGLAFCAILHSFQPDRIDFSSLDPSNIKDNCKLAFSAFEKLGIPRLLDPTQMMFSPVPDKLSVMTYVFQIKTHFTKTPVPQPSPINLRKAVPRSRPAPPPPQASREAPADSGKGNVGNSLSDTGNGGDSKETNGSKEPYNPFLEDTEDVEMDASPEGSSSPATKRSDAGDSKSSEKELISGSSDSSPESKLSMLEETSKELESNVKKEAKPPPKPPRLQQGTDSPVVDTKTKPSGSVDKKEKSVSKALFNPFDAEDNEESSPVPLKTRKPPEGYNPFDEDNSVDSQENNGSGKGRKVGSNPFDEADDNDVVTESTKAADQNVEKKEKQQRKVSYPHSFNPFGDDDDIESKGIEEKEESSSKGYNPFDDDNDNEGEGVSNNATPVKRLPRKSSLQNKEKGNQSPQTGRASPSGGLKQPVKNVKKRQAPPPPAVKSSDDPWTARLPDEVMTRRRRPTRPNTPGVAEQPSPHTSPARSGPKRSVPTPPRRPPLIPSFDEWKGDRGVAGDNERPAASQSAENLSNKTNSSEEVDESRKTSSPTPDTSARRSPKVSSGDGPNQADIKLLARQVLMDARKKAGASGALPRERVAEITKTKGPTSNAVGAQDKDNKSDNQEALKKKESLRLRREELQRKKKVNEKAQKLVQNAIGKEMGQKLAESSSEQPITEKQAKDVDAETSDSNTEQKTVKNKNLQHRPLKLKDKENESKKRRPSTEKDGNTSPDKPGFQESEELQRIRQILNQGKNSKKPSNSENIEQQNGKINPQKSDSSKERNIFDSKSSTKNATVNGFSKSTTPSAPLRSNALAPNAGLHAYIESRKINFEVFEVPADQSQSDGQEVAENDTNSCVENRVDGTSEPNSDQASSDPEETQTREFQDTSEYVRQELRSLEEQQEALDKVGEKLEMELRRAMECRGCEEEQEKLMQDWFLLVNKKNELVRRQAELNLLKNEEDLERSHDMLQRELRALLEMEDSQKTNEQREREAELMEQLLSVVNKRDQLVQFEDSQLQQAAKDALHVQNVIANARIPRDRSDCVLQ